jgi:hypothetical protein
MASSVGASPNIDTQQGGTGGHPLHSTSPGPLFTRLFPCQSLNTPRTVFSPLPGGTLVPLSLPLPANRPFPRFATDVGLAKASGRFVGWVESSRPTSDLQDRVFAITAWNRAAAASGRFVGWVESSRPTSGVHATTVVNGGREDATLRYRWWVSEDLDPPYVVGQAILGGFVGWVESSRPTANMRVSGFPARHAAYSSW